MKMAKLGNGSTYWMKKEQPRFFRKFSVTLRCLIVANCAKQGSIASSCFS